MHAKIPRFNSGIAVIAISTLFFSLSSMAADIDAGRAEVTKILDSVFTTHFRRSMRVRAALLECKLQAEADALAPTQAEESAGAFEFARIVNSSSSENVKAYLKSLDVSGNRKTLEAIYSVALRVYFTGVADGSSGGLIWVDDDDKKKLCTYMVKEGEEFLQLRQSKE